MYNDDIKNLANYRLEQAKENKELMKLDFLEKKAIM